MKTAKGLASVQPSYIREILSAASAPGIISLAGGLPANELFPLEILGNALQNLPNPSELYQYGLTQGYGPLLEHLRHMHRIPSSHDLMICNGSQQALDLIARAYLDPGEGVAIEAPSYLGALQVFSLVQAAIHPVEQTKNGPDLDRLESLFRTGTIKLFYAVPDFHNPTGVCWSLWVRKQVASLCQQYDVALIEDAPYRSLRFEGEPLPMVSTFCPERTFTLRSFSKIVAPGMRLGCVAAPKAWLSELTVIKQAVDLHTNQPLQAALLELLKHDEFDTHLANICKIYGERYLALACSLREQLPSEFVFEPVCGGMFLWLQIPGLDALQVARDALEEGLAVVPGNVFFHEDALMTPALRLNFSHSSPENLALGVSRLEKAIRRSPSNTNAYSNPSRSGN